MDLCFWFCKSTASPDFGIVKLCVAMPGYPDSNLTTGIKVGRKEWGGDRKRFLGDSDWAKLQNRELKKMEVEIASLRDFLTAAGYDVTPAFLVSVFPKMRGKTLTVENVSNAASVKQPRHQTLLETVKWFMAQVTVDGGTMDTYESRLKNLTKFLTKTGRLKMRAEDFSEPVALEFCDWFRKQDNGKGGMLSQNYLFKHIGFYKKCMKEAKRRKMIAIHPLHEFTVEKDDRKDLRHLKPSQLSKLENLSLSKIYDEGLRRKLERVKDLFVFCCYTGFHYADRESLGIDHLIERSGSLWIFKQRHKTEVEAKIKLHPKAVLIIEKYRGIENLPKIDKNDNNKLLKILEMMIGLKIGLSTKIARKTFAHHCLNVWTIDRDTTAAMMGLKTPKHIADYAEIDETRIEKMVSW